MAFQKVEGLGRDGVAGPQTLAKLQTAGMPAPMVPNGGSTRVEVDVARQVLFFYQGGSLFKTSRSRPGPVSASASTVGARPR